MPFRSPSNSNKSHESEFEYHLRIYREEDKQQVHELFENAMFWHGRLSLSALKSLPLILFRPYSPFTPSAIFEGHRQVSRRESPLFHVRSRCSPMAKLSNTWAGRLPGGGRSGLATNGIDIPFSVEDDEEEFAG